ncbi:MAG: hypothetical protein ABFC38_01360 [Methanospirillum sp.]
MLWVERNHHAGQRHRLPGRKTGGTLAFDHRRSPTLAAHDGIAVMSRGAFAQVGQLPGLKDEVHDMATLR